MKGNRWFIAGTLLLAPAALSPAQAQPEPAQVLDGGGEGFAVEAPDTTGFWFYLERGERDRARTELERLRGLAPDWQPPAAMLEALAEAPARGAEPSPAAQAEIAHGRRIARIAALAPEDRARLDPRVLDSAIAGARQRRRGDELFLLAWVSLARDDTARAKRLFEEAQAIDAQIEVAEGLRQVARAETLAALARDDEDTLGTLLAGPRRAVSSALITARAWELLDAGRPRDALPLFRLVGEADAEADGAALGTALALRGLGRQGEATQLACASEDPELSELCTGWLASAQFQAYRDEDWKQVVSLGETLEQRAALDGDARELLAWAHYRLGNEEQAVAAFLALLAAQPQRDDIAAAAYGLLEADGASLADAAGRHPAIARIRRGRARDTAFARRQFDLAARLDHEAVSGRRGLELSAALDWREREGEPGLNRLVTERLQLAAGALSGSWRWQLRAIDNEFEQGGYERGEWFGLAPLARSAPGAREEGRGFRAELSRQEPGFNVYAALARDPLGQRANPSLTGQLSFSHFGERATSAFTAYHRYRDDTMLARTGSIDLRAPVTWGGAIASGGRGLLSYPLAGSWRLTGSGFAESIDGDSVDDNFGYGLRLDLNHTLARPGNGYWRTGPFLSHWHYDENRSAFTVGHGGYFSPDRFDSLGIASELLTAEGRAWQLKAAGNIGYSVVEQAAYRRFPLAGRGPAVAGTRETGPSGELTLQFQYQFAPHWRVAGFAYYLEAVEFEASALGIELVWSPGGRSRVFSDTLPLENPWRKGFAL